MKSGGAKGVGDARDAGVGGGGTGGSGKVIEITESSRKFSLLYLSRSHADARGRRRWLAGVARGRRGPEPGRGAGGGGEGGSMVRKVRDSPEDSGA